MMEVTILKEISIGKVSLGIGDVVSVTVERECDAMSAKRVFKTVSEGLLLTEGYDCYLKG
ncbi:hypothetical protein HYP06_gp006 [Vibrio phage vB_VspP_pVa5]|uniref:Uncharacterized protein n=1 Tax=Vibrio phage vB_VspP_pVa5 TaxID=1913109 RepID=A0A1J0GVA6_9CAUD|nr:hypothetical protein HYP06_gp006 [Vibrio phage vB_VspP_pVa5]APC46121.1 hypothetical protein vBVspPpVa5_0006 [Vibrio phage vB_VspP_pVa5]